MSDYPQPADEQYPPPWKRREQIGLATLYLGDCREIAPTLARPAAVISDPPYGMAWDTDSRRFTGGNHARGEGRGDWGGIEGDAQPFDPAPWLALCRRVALWGANHYAARLPLGRTLVWVKKKPHLYGTFLSDAEIGWASGGCGVYVHEKQFPPPARMGEGVNGEVAHPTQKPLSLMRWCLDLLGVRPGDVVLDPYMGSGTTLIACVERGIACVGIEWSPTYFDVAVARVAAAPQRQGDLLRDAVA
jgi:site-specific DNA-methyltransferase (adenine-specific)